MPRYIYHPVTMKLVPAEEYYSEKYADVRRSTAVPTPRIIADGIEVKSMLDGKVYTSKAALRETYRAHGVEEVGNEQLTRPATNRSPKVEGVKDDLRRAFSQHR